MDQPSSETKLVIFKLNLGIYIVSTIATTSVVLAYMIFPKLRTTFPLRLIGYFTCFNLLYSISGILGYLYDIMAVNASLQEDEQAVAEYNETFLIIAIFGVYFRPVGWFFSLIFIFIFNLLL